MKRRHIPLRVKLEAALIQLGLDPRNVRLDHIPPLAQRTVLLGKDGVTKVYIPDEMSPWHMQFLSTSDHAEKTTGRRGTSKLSKRGGDLSEIARTKRLAKKYQEFKIAIAIKDGASSKAYMREYNREYRQRNIDDIKAQKAASYRENADKFVEKNAEYRARHKEAIRASKKAWADANRERLKAKRAEYYAANKERMLRHSAEWAKKHPEKVRATKTGWKKRNPEVVRAHGRNRRAIGKKAEGVHTATDVAAIRKAQKNRCAYCRRNLGKSGHLDHIVALAKGGSNWPKNLQWLCESCNVRKFTKDPVDFARLKGKLL